MTDEMDQRHEGTTTMDGPQGRALVVQVFVFRGDEYLGWDCYGSDRVTIGSGPEVDLRLSDPSVSHIHAVLTVRDGNLLLSYYRSHDGGGVADDAGESETVGPLDSIVIGPYTLKTKLMGGRKRFGEPAPAAGEDSTEGECSGLNLPAEGTEDLQCHAGRFNLIFEGRVTDGRSLDEVKAGVKALLRTDDDHMRMLFSGRKVVLKRDIDYRTASGLQNLFSRTGALCSLEAVPEPGPADEAQVLSGAVRPVSAEAADSEVQDRAEGKEKEHRASGEAGEPLASGTAQVPPVQRSLAPDCDDDDDEDDDRCASFSLRDMIRNYDFVGASREWNRVSGREVLLEVVRSRQGSLDDVRFLRAGEQYFIQTEGGRFCLAENRGGGKVFLHRDDTPSGTTRQLSIHEKAVIHLGPFEYLLRPVMPGESPNVKEPPRKDREYVRHFGRSVIFHVVILVILGMMPTYKPEPLSRDENRFVQVDPRQIDEIRKRIQPPQLPKKAPEIIKLKEQQVAQRRIEKRPVKTASVLPEKRVATAHTAAPAGAGDGGSQVKQTQKSVTQTGLLSMLGDNIGIKPQEAMAAVTNLDAVSSAGAGQAQFKVGGIVGKLDGGRIEIPKAGIVNTKGSSQVMTGGAGGGTRVAALEQGATGTRQVKAKVSAQLNKTVKVQGGGMSREEVKRIIDQHLEEITACYERALVAEPSLMGRVVFEWKIMLSGKVGEVRIKSSTLNSTDIHSCIQASIRTWDFPEPDGTEVIVSYPFIFDIVGF